MNKSILCILMITNLLIADNNNYEATAIKHSLKQTMNTKN